MSQKVRVQRIDNIHCSLNFQILLACVDQRQLKEVSTTVNVKQDGLILRSKACTPALQSA